MRYQGIGEPRYYLFVPQGEMRQFRPGDGQIPWIKFGFVPETFWYMANPTPAQKEQPKTAPWKAFTITWIPSDSYQKAIDLAEAIGKTSEGAGKLVIQAGAAYATGGASVAAEGASQASQAAKQALGKSLSSADTSALGLSNLLKNVGRVASESMLRNRHIDIIEDEEGKISFISLL